MTCLICPFDIQNLKGDRWFQKRGPAASTSSRSRQRRPSHVRAAAETFQTPQRGQRGGERKGAWDADDEKGKVQRAIALRKGKDD